MVRGVLVLKWDSVKDLDAEAFRRLTGVKKPTFEKRVGRKALLSCVPKKKTKKQPLTAEDKKANRDLASQRALKDGPVS